jgi:hypothetical protein
MLITASHIKKIYLIYERLSDERTGKKKERGKVINNKTSIDYAGMLPSPPDEI